MLQCQNFRSTILNMPQKQLDSENVFGCHMFGRLWARNFAGTSKLKLEILVKIRKERFVPCKIPLISDLSPSSKTLPKTGREEAKVRLEIARAAKFILKM